MKFFRFYSVLLPMIFMGGCTHMLCVDSEGNTIQSCARLKRAELFCKDVGAQTVVAYSQYSVRCGTIKDRREACLERQFESNYCENLDHPL